jgi:hypothetical protein
MAAYLINHLRQPGIAANRERREGEAHHEPEPALIIPLTQCYVYP